MCLGLNELSIDRFFLSIDMCRDFHFHWFENLVFHRIPILVRCSFCIISIKKFSWRWSSFCLFANTLSCFVNRFTGDPKLNNLRLLQVEWVFGTKRKQDQPVFYCIFNIWEFFYAELFLPRIYVETFSFIGLLNLGFHRAPILVRWSFFITSFKLLLDGDLLSIYLLI